MSKYNLKDTNRPDFIAVIMVLMKKTSNARSCKDNSTVIYSLLSPYIKCDNIYCDAETTK